MIQIRVRGIRMIYGDLRNVKTLRYVLMTKRVHYSKETRQQHAFSFELCFTVIRGNIIGHEK